MSVRFFGGWGFADQDLNSRMLAGVGYAKGVPMGGDLRTRPRDAKAPKFMVYALRDPIGANLDRIQIVKGVVTLSEIGTIWTTNQQAKPLKTLASKFAVVGGFH
jgi:hypothetical protein